MGHTLVATFSDNIAGMVLNAGLFANNKIPYRQHCDRSAANRVLPYHATLFSWDRRQDIFYLPHIDKIEFTPCSVVAEQLGVMIGTGYSYVLFLKLRPAEGFDALCENISRVTGRPTESFLHITLSVSKDQELINAQQKALAKSLRFPMTLQINALELYHIWDPVQLVKVLNGSEHEQSEDENHAGS